jgi:hypothetical protein
VKERVACPVCSKQILLVNGRLRSHGFSFGFPRLRRARCKGSGRPATYPVTLVRRPLRLVAGPYVSAPLKARAEALGLTPTVVEGLPENQWFLVTETGEHERRGPRYPCRRCRCSGFGYEVGDHPGICFCNHDDGEHGPRRSALRRWLRAERARDVADAKAAADADPLNVAAHDWWGAPGRALSPEDLKAKYPRGIAWSGPPIMVPMIPWDNGRVAFWPEPGSSIK